MSPAPASRHSQAAWCGFAAPLLGRCQCGDAANHQPGGMYYRAGRVPSTVITKAAGALNTFADGDEGGGR